MPTKHLLSYFPQYRLLGMAHIGSATGHTEELVLGGTMFWLFKQHNKKQSYVQINACKYNLYKKYTHSIALKKHCNFLPQIMKPVSHDNIRIKFIGMVLQHEINSPLCHFWDMLPSLMNTCVARTCHTNTHLHYN